MCIGGCGPTREVEKRVEDVESVGVVSLDELVGVVVLDFLPARPSTVQCTGVAGCGWRREMVRTFYPWRKQKP